MHPLYYSISPDLASMTGLPKKKRGPSLPFFCRGKLYPPPPGGFYRPEDDVFPFLFDFDDDDGNPPFDFYSAYALMSCRLFETLARAGVNNMQRYEAILTDTRTGLAAHDFCVSNIVGLVSAADMSQSNAISLGTKHVFTDLTIDPTKARGALMFRLAESPGTVIVHERVADAVRAGNFLGIILTPVTDISEGD